MLEIVYSAAHHHDETMQTLTESFKQEILDIIARCLNPANFDIASSDFNLAGIDQDDLDGHAEVVNFKMKGQPEMTMSNKIKGKYLGVCPK